MMKTDRIHKSLPLGFITLAFLLLIGPGYAGATPVGTFPSDLNSTGQTFYGDGAVFGSGYLQAPPANSNGEKCLECHRSGGSGSDKSSYLRTGHGNMVVKTTPAPQAWKGANKLPYPTDASGHPIDWTTGKVELGGWCSKTSGEGQFTEEGCVALGGTWTSGTRLVDIVYTIGGWMSVDAPDIGIMGGDLPANTFYMGDGRTYGTCGSCHNAGYKANDYTRPQPFADYSNLPKASSAGIGGSWVLDGIQCERCHDASNHPTKPQDNPTTVPSLTKSTAVCSQCHIRPGAWEGTANPNAATQPTAYPIGASATNFGSHLIGKQFLNSPHGLFTGAYSQIADKSLYGTHFNEGGSCSIPDKTSRTACEGAGGTWTRFIGGCATCHDVHQSTVPEAKANFNAQPIRRECGIACHSSSANLATMSHPTGPGTPFSETTPTTEEKAEACVICHMPKPAGGTGLNVHVFRINTSADYSTFPKQVGGVWTPGICSNPTYTTRDTCVAAGKSWAGVANSSPDGSYANAVWVDLDLACGQCHGEDGSAHLFPKGLISQFAQGMHTGPATSSDCSACHTTTTAAHPAGTNTPAECSDCHGTTRAGVKPTAEAACLSCHGASGPATHQFTADQIGTYVQNIHGNGTPSGENPMPSTSCTACHSETPVELINHPNTSCTICHSRPGVVPTYVSACTSCHSGRGLLSTSALTRFARTMHKNVAPASSMELAGEDSDPTLPGIQVKIGAAVRVTDTSTDQNKNLSSIKVTWGDNTSSTITPGGTATHSYAKLGLKTVTLTAIDKKGLKSKVVQKIKVVR